MQSAVWNTETYRTEGEKARATGKPKHANPYDYVWDGVAANAWDEGWEAGK